MTLKRFGISDCVGSLRPDSGQPLLPDRLLIPPKRKINGNERVDFTSQMFNSIIPDQDEFNEFVSKIEFLFFCIAIISFFYIAISSILGRKAENSSKGVTKNEILSNSLITIVAGYDNVASSIQVILFRLAKNPKVQSKLFQEISALCEIRIGLIK